MSLNLASGELAEKIINEVQVYSAEYGTEILFRDGIGAVRVRR